VRTADHSLAADYEHLKPLIGCTLSISHRQLAVSLGDGLLSFPVTFFDKDDRFDGHSFRRHVARQIEGGATAVCAAGGTGEFFSLTSTEYAAVIRAASEETGIRLPLLAGVGYGTRMAIEFARIAEANGADGLLVMPPYLVNCEQEGLRRHLVAICNAVSIGVIAYNRDNAVLTADSLEQVAAQCPNLIGLKDGVGNIEALAAIHIRLGTRLILLGGMPTAEVYSAAVRAMGVRAYSSAIYNFAPEVALAFFQALGRNDTDFTDSLMQRFLLPYLGIRNRSAGYAVAIVKAGMRIAGVDCGAVRSPLTDLTAKDEADLRDLMIGCGMRTSERQ